MPDLKQMEGCETNQTQDLASMPCFACTTGTEEPVVEEPAQDPEPTP